MIPSRLYSVPLLAVAVLALAGCTLGSTPPHSEESSSPSAPPAPIQLSTEAAAVRYLSIVCPSNAASDALTAAYQVVEPEYLAGGAPDPSGVKAAAQASMDTDRVAVELFDDEGFLWPEEVADLIAPLRDDYVATASTLSQIVNAADYKTAYTVTYPDFTAAQAASQELRYQLGLDADTVASCVGFENGHEELRD